MMVVVVLGTDAHKRSHTVVATDDDWPAGRDRHFDGACYLGPVICGW